MPAKKKVSAKKTADKSKTKANDVDNQSAAKQATATNIQNSKATTTAFGDIPPYAEKKGEEYMNDDQSDHFRAILNAWKQELMEEVDRTVHHMQDEAANFPDPSDRATQESEFTMELRARDRERKLIKKIDDSLSNVDSADYGFCEQCGVEIGIRRLEARPTASLCIDCKTLDEIKEKHVGN